MSVQDPPRADPEALLAAAEREARGKLRIYLGAAPGVGKTYAMLSAARAAKAAGGDVVIGIVETHGRAETEALIEGIESLPRKGVPYRGRLVPEFDLDAALARQPGLLLVDEYAHSNVEGSRHPKRWQDVQDLLAAGIDVWTTLNIQHVESLNDVVQRITGVRVRETVPDTALQKADEIILVDLPSDELIKRLADGKVYVEDTATRAVQSFFKPSNLTALRELALRRVAARVDSDLLERMQGAAIEGPWAAGERILVCVGPDIAAERVVREAKRLADLMDASWFAVTVERPGHVMAGGDRRRLEAGMRLAETLGAETRSLVAADVASELLRFARFENVTQIIIGKARRWWLARLLRGSLADALVKQADGVAIHVVTAEAGEVPARRRFQLPPAGQLAGYSAAVLSVGAATVTGLFLTRFVALPNVSMLYLLAVLLPALLYGVWPAILASTLSFLAYNFFFIDPVETFTVARPHELLALLIFLIVAVLISTIAGRAREQARIAAQRMRATRRLYEFTRKLSALPDRSSVAEAAAVELHTVLGRPSVILLSEHGDLSIAAAWPPEDRLDTGSMTAANWAFEHGEAAGAGTGTLPSVPWLFRPLGGMAGGTGGGAPIGVVGIERDPTMPVLDAESESILGTLSEQTAAALVRTMLSAEVTRARTAAETERVRNILLASISHDFRTPLASILGAATSLIDYGPDIPAEVRRDLLAQMRDEAENLDHMVRNLLSMTRLEAGALEIHKDWVDAVELMNRAVSAVRRRGATQRFVVTSAPDLPLIQADQSLMDQALGNVVANAVRYAGKKARIGLAATVIENELVIAVTDDGPGIPAQTLPHVFEKFVRASRGAADGGDGSGLGLAITKGIVEAHGGRVAARSPAPGQRNGTRITMKLPLPARAPEGEGKS